MRNKNKLVGNLLIALLLTTAVACGPGLVIQNVDYSQPLETVAEPNDDGVVKDMKHGLRFNIQPIQYRETQDTSTVTDKKIHIIRNNAGYYFITASGYDNVYVMKPASGELALHKKIELGDQGISKPAFNQRDTYIQLIDQEAETTYQLTEKGIR